MIILPEKERERKRERVTRWLPTEEERLENFENTQFCRCM
jgi:hypothetical protein